MKIIFILTAYEIGGVSTVARNLIDSLDRLDIVVLTERTSEKHYPVGNRARFINLDISSKRGVFAKAFNIIRHLRLMRKHILNEAPDVVISFGCQVNCYALLSLLFRKSERPRVIITEHSEEMFLKSKGGDIRHNISKNVYKILIVFLYHGSDYIVTVSRSIARHIKRLVFVDPRIVKVIYNPVNIDKINQLCKEERLSVDFKNNLPYIGTISRLSPEKGVHFLIYGFKNLLDKVNARLIIVGDGVERIRLEKMARDLDIEDKVTFTGWQDNPFKYLARMDIFVLPSLWEGFSNVILEAMACGVPVIASDSTGGIREAIKSGVDGLLIEPKSPSLISETVYYLLSNREEREKIIKEAHKTVRRFDLDVIEKQYKALFDI